MTGQLKWRVFGVVALFGVVGLVACSQGDGKTATSPSLPSPAAGAFETTGATSQRAELSGSDESSEDPNSEDPNSDDPNSDDPSSDDPSSDDPSSDDPSSDDPSSDDASSDDLDDDDSSDELSLDGDDDGNSGQTATSRVRGLFFGFAECTDCTFALRIKDTIVVVTDATQIDNEPALAEGLAPTALEALLTGNLGLPMRAEGVSQGGVLRAARVRIDDEIRATGVVGAASEAPGCSGDLTLRVRDAVLCFELSSGLASPPVGAEAKIEGVTPSNFAPFVATRIETES